MGDGPNLLGMQARMGGRSSGGRPKPDHKIGPLTFYYRTDSSNRYAPSIHARSYARSDIDDCTAVLGPVPSQ